ncbi:hypothetical protein HYU40_04415 [Candidatus Woesearchaeota archaeon]|nr:hypothetical protein [Candidatus Woesearchaeota archaeon]
MTNMTIDLTFEDTADTAKLDKQLAALVGKLQRGQPVLLFNQYSGNERPSTFIIDYTKLYARNGENKPLVSIRASGVVYELNKEGNWVPASIQWGKNFFPEKGSYIAVGRNEIAQTLQSKDLKHPGELPF